MKQCTNTVLMVRPARFGPNEQTAVNNYFQRENTNVLPSTIHVKAQQEFDALVVLLQTNGIEVIVLEDTPQPLKPDAVFPNNWISFHENGDVTMYPMFAENRRWERREDVLQVLEENNFVIEHIVDYAEAEDEDVFLEGTGSMVLDRVHRKAYAAVSPRTDEDLFIEFCEDFEYTPVIFSAYQSSKNKKELIYHTNVMLCVTETFAIVALETIIDKKERKNVVKHLKSNAKEILAITEKQMQHFAGNMLQLRGENDTLYLVMSTTAYTVLTEAQLAVIEKHCTVIHTDISTIEKYGGGSVRCMLAEVFLPRAN